jgi:hypothetical protein
MDESHAIRFQATTRASGEAVELSQDELEHVVGGLQRTWIKPPTGSDDTLKVENHETTLPGTSRVIS